MNKLLTLGMFNRQGMKAFNEGRYEDAIFQLNQAGMIASQMKTSLHTAKVCNNIGLVHMGTGNRSEALIHFRQAEEAAVQGAGPGNSLHRTILRNMGQLAKAA
jgi:hypothetical protein